MVPKIYMDLSALGLLCWCHLVQTCCAEAMNTRFQLFLCLQNNLQVLAVQYVSEGQEKSGWSLRLAACVYAVGRGSCFSRFISFTGTYSVKRSSPSFSCSLF